MTRTRTKSIPAIESNRIDVRYIGRDGSVAPWRSWSLPCLPLMSDRSRSPEGRGAMLNRISPAGDRLTDLRRLYIRWQCCHLALRRHPRPSVPIRSISFYVDRISSARSEQNKPNTHTHTHTIGAINHGYQYVPRHGLVVGQEHLALLYPHRKSLCPPKVFKPKLFIEIDSCLMGSFALSSRRSGC